MVKFKSSEITPEKIYKNRRNFIKNLGLATGSLYLSTTSYGLSSSTDENELRNQITAYNDITTYNNYYEFGTQKADPHKNSKNFKTDPWSVTIEGAVQKKITLSMDDIKKLFPTEERVYRLRCVEGWSMVIPWNGFPLKNLLNKVEPLGKAKFVSFETIYDPEQMVGQRYPILKWPYIEGLRIDEAMNPLTLMVTGLYGKDLPTQTG